MPVLVICEKPSVAADVAKALSSTHTFERQPWGYGSAGMLVAAAAGHLVEQLPPERYDERYKKWVFDDLPILPEVFRYQPRDQRAGERLRQIAELIRRPDVTELVNACDAGREGELIFKLIVQYAKSSKPIKRAWFSSMTVDAIRQAFAALRDDRELVPLESAARSRAEADWVVGMNATRAASCTLGGNRMMLSLGRVQTPTLAMVVRRDLEIEGFVPQDYFQVLAAMHAANGELATMWRSSREPDARDRFDVKEDAEVVAARTRSAQTGTVIDVAVREENVGAPRLFDLTDLQREANKRHGLTAAKTLAAAQALYETHKFLSYPRTDSRYLTTDMATLVPKLVTRVKAADQTYAAAADAVSAACDPSVVINDAKVNDHHAIIPTDAVHDLSVLSADERKVYDLVVRRFLAALLPPQRLERTVVWVSVGTTPDLYRASGRRELEPGFRIAWPESSKPDGGKAGKKDAGTEDDEPEDDGLLPQVAVGEVVRIGEVAVAARQTKPPARFNEASLLGQMATAGRLVTDEDAAEAMKESGLGTPATRAATVEKLIAVEYLERQGRQLRATSKGRGVILALGEHPLVSPDLTGSWEQRLHQMERANHDDALSQRQAFDADVRAFATEITAGFAEMTPDRLAAGRRVVAPCPVPGCTGSVVESKRGWGCDSWKSKEEPGCGFSVWKEQAGKRVTEKELARRIEDVRSGKVTVTPPTQRVVLGTCPRCSAEIVERQRSWGCSSWRSPKETGCGYVIWKQDPDGSVVDEARARDMLALGRTNEREKPPAFAPCPRCDGSIVEREKFFGCDSWRSPRQSGCGTVVWKVQAGHAVTTEEALAQLEEMKGTPAPKKRPAKKPPRSR